MHSNAIVVLLPKKPKLGVTFCEPKMTRKKWEPERATRPQSPSPRSEGQNVGPHLSWPGQNSRRNPFIPKPRFSFLVLRWRWSLFGLESRAVVETLLKEADLVARLAAMWLPNTGPGLETHRRLVVIDLHDVSEHSPCPTTMANQGQLFKGLCWRDRKLSRLLPAAMDLFLFLSRGLNYGFANHRSHMLHHRLTRMS